MEIVYDEVNDVDVVSIRPRVSVNTSKANWKVIFPYIGWDMKRVGLSDTGAVYELDNNFEVGVLVERLSKLANDSGSPMVSGL